MLSQSDESQLQATARALGMERDWLYNVIRFESAWNPRAYNPSGATGLIQFMPKVMKDFRLLSASLAAQIPAGDTPVPEAVKQAARNEFLLKYPTISAQLQGPIFAYFKRYGPYDSEERVYLAVLYPAWRDRPLTTVLPALVQKQNPGIVTLADYVNRARGTSATAGIAKATGAVGLIALAVGAYFLFTHSA